MTRHTRAVVLVAAVALAFLAAVNVGGAAPGSPAVGAPTVRQFQGLPMCQPGQQPTLQAPCNPGRPQDNPDRPQDSAGPNRDELAPCAPGQVPSPQAPCKFDIQPCAAGQMPSPTAPCRPQGGMPGEEGEEETGGFDAAPTSAIQKDMKKKFMVININIEGSGDDEGTFYVTFVKVVSGVNSDTKEYLNSQLADESFVISSTKKTKCFADTKDADKVPDLVSCGDLSEAADNIAGSVKAQFRGKVAMDESTFEPVFTAQKIVFLKGKYNIAKID